MRRSGSGGSEGMDPWISEAGRGWKATFFGWVRQAGGWLYPRPPLCLLCRDGRLTSLSEPLCPECLGALPRFQAPPCEWCGQPTEVSESEDGSGRSLPRWVRRLRLGLAGGPVTCWRCRARPPNFTRARAVMPYQGWVRAAVHRLKYRGEAELAVPLGRLMGVLAREELLFAAVSAVVPVPLHPDRLRERGYNQSELLAEQVAAAIGRPLRPGMLERRRPTPPQVGLSEWERRQNLQGAFAVADPSGVAGRRLLLVDDVFTTGTTCREATRALLEAGSRSVYVLTLAVTPWPGGYRDPNVGTNPTGPSVR